MAGRTFLLLPGAGGAAWVWHRVAALLEAAGDAAIALELPGADPVAGLDAYADLAVAALGTRRDVTLVAQSMGGFTAAAVAARVPGAIARIVFVNAMIPNPHETPGDWWGNTGSEAARLEAAARGGYPAELGLDAYFLHDLPAAVAEGLMHHDGEEAATAFGDPAPFDAWPPGVPLHAIGGADDRLFPVGFQARVARERLGVTLEVLPGGHMMALSHPAELTARLRALATL